MVGSRYPSHQLSNGLYVSGRPKKPKERRTTSPNVMPYTGGDVFKSSGELGKMFDIIPTLTMDAAASAASSSKSRKSIVASTTRERERARARERARGEGISAVTTTTNVSMNKTNYSGVSPLNNNNNNNNNNKQGGGEPIIIKRSSGTQRKVFISGGGSLLETTTTSASSSAATSATPLSPKPTTILGSIILIFVMGFVTGAFILGAVHNAILIILLILLTFHHIRSNYVY